MAINPDRVQVDSHSFLRGRERPPPEDCDDIFGRRHGDAEKLFPRTTHASAASTGEVEISGKVLQIWTFQQLETLTREVLKNRALTLRDAVGEDRCPPLPSGQKEDFIRWICHMQEDIVGQEVTGPARLNDYGGTHHMPSSFAQDTMDRPIVMERKRPESPGKAPFGPRTGHTHDATRDHYHDLKFQKNDFKDPPVQGIVTLRAGGEGRRVLPTQHSMQGCGVSTAEPRGIQTLRAKGEGRRYLGCEDHLMEQKRESQEYPDGPPRLPPPRSNSPRPNRDPVRHVSECHMHGHGQPLPPHEPHIGGERRRQAPKPTSMVNHGTSSPDKEVDVDSRKGRKYLDSFAGPKSKFGDTHGDYQSTWKKDHTRLKGTSMLV